MITSDPLASGHSVLYRCVSSTQTHVHTTPPPHPHTTTLTHSHKHTSRQTDKGKWMLLFPLEDSGHLLFLSHADRAGGSWVVGVRCQAVEARLSRGSTCSANCWEDREGQRERDGESEGKMGVMV